MILKRRRNAGNPSRVLITFLQESSAFLVRQTVGDPFLTTSLRVLCLFFAFFTIFFLHFLKVTPGQYIYMKIIQESIAFYVFHSFGDPFLTTSLRVLCLFFAFFLTIFIHHFSQSYPKKYAYIKIIQCAQFLTSQRIVYKV